MIVTINTDASLLANKYAGYAFWIVCNDGRIQKAGKIKEIIKSPSDAELCCIANALYILSKSKWKGISKVIVNTDSKISIDSLNGTSGIPSNNKFKRKCYDEAMFSMMEILIKSGRSIREVYTFFEFRHVKAHSGVKDARSVVNEWCDQQSKKYSNLRKQEK